MPIRPSFIPRIKRRKGSNDKEHHDAEDQDQNTDPHASSSGPIHQDSGHNPGHNEHREGESEEYVGGSPINWNNPTLANVKNNIVGERCKKPFDPASRVNRDTAKRNRRIISLNVRRKKMIVWILIFAVGLTWMGFIDIFNRIRQENGDGFSISIIKPWLIPILSVETLLTGIGLIMMMLKMKFISAKFMNKTFRIVTSLNNIHYLMVMVALPIAIYYVFNELSRDMKKSLMDVQGVDVGPDWNATQRERQCCGFHSRTDWQATNNVSFLEYEHDDEDPEDDTDAEETHREYYYPLSCCNRTAIDNGGICTESSKLYHTRGCHDLEFYVILDYFVCVETLMLLAFLLSVLAKIWVERTTRYLKIFRPYEVI